MYMNSNARERRYTRILRIMRLAESHVRHPESDALIMRLSLRHNAHIRV